MEEDDTSDRLIVNGGADNDDDLQDIAQKIYGRRQQRQQQQQQHRSGKVDKDDDGGGGGGGDNDNECHEEIDEQQQSSSVFSRPCEILAPMVRASTTPLRTLALRYGADMCYSEELVDRSISSTRRVDNHELGTIDYVKDSSMLSKKTLRKLGDRPCLMLRISKRDELPSPSNPYGRFICQLGTGEPELALPAAQRVYQDVSAFDINMGCPKKFSVSGGMGSALLSDPDRASRIIKTLRHGLTSSSNKKKVPVSCKIRLLPTTKKTVEFIDAMINAGANAIAIHARQVGQDSVDEADWKSLEEVLGLLRPKYSHIPFLVNGDFYDRHERFEFMERTQVDGVLLARPALYNCSTFFERSRPLIDKTTVVQEYLTEAVRYETHPKNAKYVICEMMTNRRTPTNRVLKLPIQFPGGQTIAQTCDCQDIQSLCKVWNVQYSRAIQYKQQQQQECKQKYVEMSSGFKGVIESTSTISSTPLANGEHRYDDSYILKRLNTTDGGHNEKQKGNEDENPISSESIEIKVADCAANKRPKLQ
jgi:tRNA-dihydrouridine synthase 2